MAAEKIMMKDGHLHVPNEPVIPFIEGDGTGRISGALPFV